MMSRGPVSIPSNKQEDCNPPKYLEVDSHRLAYVKHTASRSARPSVIFLGGFMSNMNKTKAIALEAHCKQQDYHYIRFDYVGHGLSSGDFVRGNIGLWRDNSIAILDKLTEGKQLIVGSSMGGWLALLVTLVRPERVGAVIGVAPAPDFTKWLIEDRMSEVQRLELMGHSDPYHYLEYPSKEGGYVYQISKQLIEEGNKHILLNGPIPIKCPVHLVHGMVDHDVPYQLSIDLAEKLTSEKVQVHLLKKSNHSMSEPYDLKCLYQLIDSTFNIE